MLFIQPHTLIIKAMKIDVRKVTKLSNLTLTEDEEQEFNKQLNDIIGYIALLNKLDTSNIKPTAQVTGLANELREDEKNQESLSPEEALSGANKKYDDMFVVDKLVDTTD